MIEINLLPNTGRKKARRSGGGGGLKLNLDIRGAIAKISERVRDPWLVGAIATTVVVAAAVGLFYVMQARREATLDEALKKALADSTRYAGVLRERERAEAKRDTVLRSLNLVRAIDDDRFVWPHVLDEVSRALPPYTWLVSIAFTGTPQGQTLAATLGAPPPEKGKRKGAVQTTIPRDTIRLRLVGNTVDIQALTRFMKQLESSPFLEQVQLAKSERAADNGKEVTQFQLDMVYTRPDPALVRRVPLLVSVR